MGLNNSFDIDLKFELQPKQRLMIEAPSSFTLLAGSAGGGKSMGLRFCSITYAISMPGIQIYIMRRELKSLLQSFMEGLGGFPSLLQPLVEAKVCKINYSTNTISFKNGGNKRNKWAGGSVIKLIHLSSDSAIESLTGAEIGLA